MHPALITDQEFAQFLELVRDGKSNHNAAIAIGTTYGTLQKRFESKPEWQDMFREAADQRRLVMAERVDRRLDELVADEKPAPAIVLAWAKRWNDEYRDKSTVETTVSGTLEMRTPEVVEALERFSASVVQAASRVRTGQAPGITVTAGNGGAGLPVGKLDGKTRPDRT